MLQKQKKAKNFIVTVHENQMHKLKDIAKSIEADGNRIHNISKMFGIININSGKSLEDLKKKYTHHGVDIEPEGEKSI